MGSVAILVVCGLVAASLGLWLEPLLVLHRVEDRGADHGNVPMGLVPIVGAFHLRTPAKDEPGGFRSPSRAFAVQAIGLELALAAVFAALVLRQANSSELVLASLYTAILFEIAVIDFHYRLVLNILSYPAAALAIIGSLIWAGVGLPSSLAGGAIALVLFFVIEIVGRGAMGRGDTKLAGVIGLMRGFPGGILSIVIGITVGGLMAAALLLLGKGRKATFAYGPALAIGAVLSFFIAGS